MQSTTRSELRPGSRFHLGRDLLFRDMHVVKTVSLHPACHILDIAVRRAELLSKLFGREPLVVTRRRLVLLVVEQPLQFTFLFKAALENKQHAVQPQVEGCRHLVELRSGEGMDVAWQHYEIFFINSLSDACGDVRRLCGHTAKKENQDGSE